MASVALCALCRVPEKIRLYLESNKRTFIVYSIFLVLLAEWFSIIYQSVVPQTLNMVYDSYLFFWYPLLTQFVLGIVFFSLFLWKERLHFCGRKSATTFYLSMYYLLGFFAVLFCFSATFYYAIISYTSIGLATMLFVSSIIKDSE